MKKFSVLVLLLFASTTALAQETRTFAIDCWSGGHCAMPCAGGATGNYDCSDGSGSWTSGCAYNDTLPAGTVVTRIQAIIYTHQCASSSTVTATMNGQPIATVTESRSSCSCLSSPCLDTVAQSPDHAGGFPGYNVGGLNTLGIAVTSGTVCISNVAITLTLGGKTATITTAPPSITNNSDAVGGCVQYRGALEGVVMNNGQPEGNVSLRFTSDRNTGGATPDAIGQRQTTTDSIGHISGEVITRKQGTANIGADIDPAYRVTKGVLLLQRAYYENRFRNTAYVLANEADFAGGAQVTNPCGLTGTFYERFLTSNRGVLMEGSGRSLGGDIITIDWNASGSPLNRNNVCFRIDTCARTASGACASANSTLAVDPDKIPMGASVEIERLAGTRVAQDTGGRIRGYHIDNFIGFGDAALASWRNFHGVVTYLGGGPSPCN